MSVLRPAFARLLAFATAAVLVSVTATGVGARQALDRTKPPAPGKTPDLRVPTWTKSALPDGADLIVSEKHDLPLVAFSLTFLGGANQFEPADKTGLASLTAAMMSEGTKSKDGEALSNALQLLGTSVSTTVGGGVRVDELRLDHRQVAADAGHRRRHAPQLDVSRRRAGAASGAAARRADPGPGAARSDCRTRVPKGPVRRRASVRPGGDRGVAQGDHP